MSGRHCSCQRNLNNNFLHGGNSAMKKWCSLLLFFTLLGIANACPEQFVCDQNGCKRVPVASCSSDHAVSGHYSPPASSSTTYGPTHSVLFSSNSATVSSPSPAITYQTNVPHVNAPPIPQQSTHAFAPACAENGSCYGDISSINGMPKTTHVNGYYRRDGTYVRGHYRSSGRR